MTCEGKGNGILKFGGNFTDTRKRKFINLKTTKLYGINLNTYANL